MPINLFESTTIPLMEQVVYFTKARHAVLAGNIANMDTPGHQARDISVEDFQSQLKQAIAAREQPGNSSPGEKSLQSVSWRTEVAKDPQTLLRHDGNQVSMEHEVSEMIKNKGQHDLALAVMVSQFRLLQTAIQGRP